MAKKTVEKKEIVNLGYGTGRRKTSVARVYLREGNGNIIVNGKAIDEYFVDAISVFHSNGLEVALGEPTDVSLKERVVTGLLDQVQGITYIDVRNPESPTYRSAPSA